MRPLNPAEIGEIIKKKIGDLALDAQLKNEGAVLSVNDGIVRIHGLSDAQQGEMLAFPRGDSGAADTFGLALNLERDSVGAVILGEYEHITEGDRVQCTGRVLEVPVGDGLIGRVLNPLGHPIDGHGAMDSAGAEPIEKNRSRRHLAAVGFAAAGDRTQSHRYDGADWARTAGINYRRPPNRQNRRRGGCDY